MKSYETIWEIFNKCPNNQMRDVFIDEVEVADTDAYIRQKFQDKNATWEKSVLPDGTICVLYEKRFGEEMYLARFTIDALR